MLKIYLQIQFLFSNDYMKTKMAVLKFLKGDFLIVVAAFIWGTAFVAQRLGMEHVGPFTYNGIRFILGGLVILPLYIINKKKHDCLFDTKKNVKGSILAGSVLFIAASLQQIGIIYTTAAKAGFITGLYVILVPIFGMLIHQRTSLFTWIGATLAMVGLYFLSFTSGFHIESGDLLVLISAFFWALHIHIIGWLSPKMPSIRLALGQFLTCGIISLIVAFSFETVSLKGIYGGITPILYGGILSIGIAYTLQITAQKRVKPAHASIIFSLESPFAALGGWFILGEVLSPRGIAGCILMLSGMLISQFIFLKKPKRKQ